MRGASLALNFRGKARHLLNLLRASVSPRSPPLHARDLRSIVPVPRPGGLAVRMLSTRRPLTRSNSMLAICKSAQLLELRHPRAPKHQRHLTNLNKLSRSVMVASSGNTTPSRMPLHPRDTHLHADSPRMTARAGDVLLWDCDRCQKRIFAASSMALGYDRLAHITIHHKGIYWPTLVPPTTGVLAWRCAQCKHGFLQVNGSHKGVFKASAAQLKQCPGAAAPWLNYLRLCASRCNRVSSSVSAHRSRRSFCAKMR